MILACTTTWADQSLVILQVTPTKGSPVDLYNIEVGSQRELIFNLPIKVSQVVSAQLAMMVDDIDSRSEASIRLNGGDKLHIPDAAVAEGQFHPAFMAVPADRLVDGQNIFQFSFDSNLGNSTRGFVIDEAYLILTVATDVGEAVAKLPKVKLRKTDNMADFMEHRSHSDPVFTITGSVKLKEGFEIPCKFLFPIFGNSSDGRMLMFSGASMVSSADGGRTWSDIEKLAISVNCMIRMNGGQLGARSDMTFYVSPDDGKTWEKRGNIAGNADMRWEGRGVAHFDVMIQTKSGRLIVPVRGSAAANQWLAQRSAARAIFLGKEMSVEGHAHRPEADYTIIYYSDDQGRSWKKADGTIMIWKDDGFGGMWPADEPNIIELKNGDVVLYFRTSLGRIYTARSSQLEFTISGGRRKGQVIKAKPGEYFEYPKATNLAASYTPCRIKRIPTTGDLLLIWNQVTSDEMRGGHSRGRLSSAISKDDGQTWQHYRTIDRTVLAPAGRVEPDDKPQMARALKFIGELTPGYGHVDYPNVAFHEDKVMINWIRGIQYPISGEFTGSRLRVVPVSWFYGDDQPYQPPKSAPVLMINDQSVAGLFIDDDFLVNSRDIAKALGISIDANMLAPLHQVLTHLKLKPTYDRSQMKDGKHPMLKVAIVSNK